MSKWCSTMVVIFMKQFIRGKPIRFGYKNLAMCCSDTGYCFNFDLYEGKKATELPISGLGASVVLNMIAKVNVPSDHIFYFDNFFTSFDLIKVLTERSISASGTVRINRTNKCPLSTDDNLKKQDRGFYDYRMDSKSDLLYLLSYGKTITMSKCCLIIKAHCQRKN